MSANVNTSIPTNALRITPRLIVGLGVLAVGVLWTLDNLDILESDQLLEWWPAIIVLAGLVRLFDSAANRIGSVVMMIIGSMLLVDSIDIADVDFGDFIPLGIALIGAKLVWDALGRKTSRTDAHADPASTVHAFAIMAGIRRQSTTREFRGGDANAIMGGVELDLRNAQMRDDQEAIIDVFAMWGGVDIQVPENWRVVDKVMPVLGGFEDKTVNRTGTGPVLIVRGSAVMGAIEVKN